jgi:hypothetical protein
MHHPVCKKIPSVEEIVVSTQNSQWQIERLGKRRALLMWRTIWWISFVMFWAILAELIVISTNSQKFDVDYIWIIVGLAISNSIKWFSGGMYCDRLGRLYHKINQPASSTKTPSSLEPE